MRKLRHEEIPRLAPDALDASPRHPVVGVLDNIRSIYNVGSIFRTSDAAWIEHLWLTGYTGTPEHRRLHKTALGAQDTIPWTAQRDPHAVVDRLRAEGYTIAVLEITDAPTSTTAVPADAFPLALLVGNEVEGVQDSLVARADLALELPQFGAKQSLNVAVAYGIAVFDLVRRFRQTAGLPTPNVFPQHPGSSPLDPPAAQP